MTSRSRSGFRVAILALFTGLWIFYAYASASDREEQPAAYDCGTLSLYTLLHLEGRSISLPQIECELPTPSPAGHSMKALREAAGALGLDLVGVRLPESRNASDRPALVFLDRAPHGHFVVVRPVGHSSTLVQMLDAHQPPIVIDAADLYASPDWTGLALMPTRRNWLFLGLGGATAGMALSLVLLRFRSPKHRRWLRKPLSASH